MKYLIVVDMQNDFIDGALGTAEAVSIVPYVKSVIENFDGKVIFTRDTHFENYLETREGRNLPVVHCVKGTDGWQVYGQTAEALNEVGDKVSADEKATVQADIDALKAILAQSTPDTVTDAQVADIKAAKEKLMASAQALFTKMYESMQGAQGAGPDMSGAAAAGYTSGSNAADDDIIDGDFIFGDDNLGLDSDGHMMMVMGRNMMMDLETGDIHLTNGDDLDQLDEEDD